MAGAGILLYLNLAQEQHGRHHCGLMGAYGDSAASGDQNPAYSISCRTRPILRKLASPPTRSRLLSNPASWPTKNQRSSQSRPSTSTLGSQLARRTSGKVTGHSLTPLTLVLPGAEPWPMSAGR